MLGAPSPPPGGGPLFLMVGAINLGTVFTAGIGSPDTPNNRLQPGMKNFQVRRRVAVTFAGGTGPVVLKTCPWWPRANRRQWYSVRGRIQLNQVLADNRIRQGLQKLGQPVRLSIGAGAKTRASWHRHTRQKCPCAFPLSSPDCLNGRLGAPPRLSTAKGRRTEPCPRRLD